MADAKQDFISSIDAYILAAVHLRHVSKSWVKDENLPPSAQELDLLERRRTLHALERERIAKRSAAIAAGHILGGRTAIGIVAVLELPDDNLDRLINDWIEAKKDLSESPQDAAGQKVADMWDVMGLPDPLRSGALCIINAGGSITAELFKKSEHDYPGDVFRLGRHVGFDEWINKHVRRPKTGGKVWHFIK